MNKLHNAMLELCVIIILSAVLPSAWTDEPPWRFAVLSDTQGSLEGDSGVGPYLNVIAKAIAAEDPPVDFVLVNGDLISGGANHSDGKPDISTMFQTWFTDMAPVYDAGIKVYPVRGNHETYTLPFGLPENDTKPWLDAFAKFDYIPSNGPADATRLIYSFQHKNALVIGLDFYIQNAFYPTIPQAWIDEQLAANKLPHVLVCAHLPIVQANMQSVVAEDDSILEADTFFDSLVNAGCKIYFCGHDHFHNRAVLTRDGKHLCQYICGTGGGRHYPWYENGFSTAWSKCDITAQLAYYDTDHFGYTLVTVTDDKSFSTEWKVLVNGSSSPDCISLDPFSYNYDKLATAGMITSLYVGSSNAEPKVTSGYTLTATVSYSDPVKGDTKNLKKETVRSSSIPTTFEYQWLNKITMYDKKLWDPASTAAENLAKFPVGPLECNMSVNANDGVSSEIVAYYPPIITSAVNTGGEQIYTVTTNQKFQLHGSYFGTRAPTVYLEYVKNGKVAAFKLKVDPSSFSFPDIKGNKDKSCMDLNTGSSMLVLVTPKSWPKGWDTAVPHNIVVYNGLAKATMPFCIATPSPY